MVSLKASRIYGLGECTWPSVRHLHLHTATQDLLRRVDPQALLQLETLTLHYWVREGESDLEILSNGQTHLAREDLDLSRLQSLRRLHIEDWSPRSISVTEGCRVHAVWKLPFKGQEWLLSPCWQIPGSALASLQINAERSMLTPVHMRAIQAVLKSQTGLELLKIASVTLGSKEVPLTFPREPTECLMSPLRIEICTTQGCWIDESIPPTENLVIKIDGPICGRGQDGSK